MTLTPVQRRPARPRSRTTRLTGTAAARAVSTPPATPATRASAVPDGEAVATAVAVSAVPAGEGAPAEERGRRSRRADLLDAALGFAAVAACLAALGVRLATQVIG
jgi:hypothetical protein